MPASRLAARRRKSSLGIGISLAQPGNYGLASPRPVTFAPNVTPGTYVEDVDASESDDASSPTNALFPPTQLIQASNSRRRVPPGKRRSQGYIPRPPNAFMLFRANFVRQKHVPGSIETNHGSLSKIIGNIWKNLPPEEQETWKKLAKKAKAEHRQMYPNYRFRPVHNKNKLSAKRKDKALPDMEDERRCEEVAQLLLDGKKGEELTAAVRQLDMSRSQWSPAATPPPFAPGVVAPTPLYALRRPSSVPPPTRMYNPITIPTVPFFSPFSSGSRPESPVGNIARSNRFFLGPRRPSSTGPTYYGTWNTSQSYASIPIEQLQRDEEPLPDVPSGLFNTSFGFDMAPHSQTTFSDPTTHTNLALSISPLDGVHVESLLDPLSASTAVSSDYPYSAVAPAGPSMPWVRSQFDDMTLSGSASPAGFTPSPSTVPSEVPPVADANTAMYAPQPQHAQNFQGWGAIQQASSMANMQAIQNEVDFALQYAADVQSGVQMQDYACGLESANIYGDISHCALDAQDFAFQQELALAIDAHQF